MSQEGKTDIFGVNTSLFIPPLEIIERKHQWPTNPQLNSDEVAIQNGVVSKNKYRELIAVKQARHKVGS